VDDDPEGNGNPQDTMPTEPDPFAPPEREPWRSDAGTFLPGARHPWAFEPGKSGNPKGRPRRKPLTDDLLARIHAVHPNDPQGRTILQILNASLIASAIKGSVSAQRELRDRLEGKVPMTLRLGPEVDEESKTDLAITVVDVTASVPQITGGNGEAKDGGGDGDH